MKRDEIRYLLRRYRFIREAIERKRPAAFIQIGNRKERVTIDDAVKKFDAVVRKAFTMEKSEYVRDMMELVIAEGKSDVYITSYYKITKSSFYRIKTAFLEKFYALCVFEGLVAEDEIWEN